MRLKINLQIKLLVAAACIIVLALSILSYLNAKNQRESLYDSFKTIAVTLAQGLDASVSSRSDFDDVAKIQSNIYKALWLNQNKRQFARRRQI